MASNPTLATGHHQYATTSPLDQIVNGNHAVPPRHALLDRAMTLTRKTQVKPREYKEEITRSGMSNNVLADGSNHFGYAMGGEDNEIYQQQTTGSSRQRVQDLRAARLSQQQTVQSNPTSSILQPNHSRPSHASTLISNAFRDSVASDMSFNSISGPDERYSMVGGYDAVNEGTTEDDPGRIAEAVRGLALRRRQSIDTVRSSEFGEGGKWDRAWGGSDEEDEEEDYMLNQNFALSNLDIEGRAAQSRGGALDQINQGQWSGREEEQKRRTITANDRNPAQFPSLHDASGVEHVVSLMTSLQRPKQTLGIGSTSGESAVQKEAGPHAHIQRRDTLMSMVGDVGESSSSSLRAGHHQYRDSNATVGASNVERPLSFASDSSRSNAHVYVWPPTPAASEHGSSNEGGNDGQYSKRDTLLAYPAGVGIGQRAMVEYADTPASLDVTTSYPSPIEPMSPSAALARPLDSPILEPDGTASSRREKAAARASYGSGSGHPTGRLPPQPPGTTTTSMNEERYADPNQPLYSPMYGELGRMRKKAIEEQGGRESLVSDLDVETLRLDGGSEDWGSRRGSTSSLGSFSSDKIRDQRQRRSQASIMSTYSDKRSSSGTIQEQSRQVQARDISQHHSWNGAIKRGESQPGPQVETIEREIGPPKRSNTGPDSYQTPIQQQQPASLLTGNSPALQHSLKSTPTMTKTNGSSLTFMTPQPDRETRKQTNVTVAVKGALNNSQAERFLTLAITHHESGDLSRSAYYFERSAKVEGGCVVGMCMWGMALREGWGVRKDQLKGFDWISRAAARAGEMMAGSQGSGKGVMNKGDAELKAIRSELKLSVYELGKCFCYGWGVKMDKPMALEYFELAAKLGDSDAQAEAGALLAAGKGCKKDLKKAAMYYRMAEAQGYDTVGLSWIHKDKYDPSPVANTKYK